jgi:basic membrane protein A
VKARKLTLWATAALALVALVATTAATAGPSRYEKPAAKHATFKVGLVTDIGGLNDRGFNHLAYVGLLRAKAKLGVQTRVLTSSSNADYIPNLSQLAQQHYDLIIAVGFLMTDAVNTVAQKFPNLKFAGVDESINDLPDKPSNFTGIKFKEQEAGYLVGYLAGLEEKRRPGADGASTVGGQKIPPVDRYIAGFQAGAKKADPKIKLQNGYSQNFVDQALCKELALNQIAAGSHVIFQVAGGCGLGALDAAKTKKVWGIGVDADQSSQGSQMLTSATKKVDIGVFLTAQKAKKNLLPPQKDVTYGLAQGGVGLGKISSKVPKSEIAKVNAVAKLILKGKIKIPQTVK